MGKRHSLAEDIISGRPVISVVGAETTGRVDTAPKQRRARKVAPAVTMPVRFVTVPVRMTEEQRRALVKEATRRMEERGAGRLDASEVVRELVDAWMEER